MIYRMSLPPRILISQAKRSAGSFSESFPKYHPTGAAHLIHISRQIRQEALPLISSRLRYMIPLDSRDSGRTIDYTFEWLQRVGPRNTDSLRKVSISYYDHYPPLHKDIYRIFDTMARLPRVSLQFNTTLSILAFTDSEMYMALANMHGFTHASFVNWNAGFQFCDQHSQQTRDSQKLWKDLGQRFQQAVTRLTSPCPAGGWCRSHGRSSRYHGTSSVEIGWYKDGSCRDINCVNAVLGDRPPKWKPGPHSIFISNKQARIVERGGWPSYDPARNNGPIYRFATGFGRSRLW